MDACACRISKCSLKYDLKIDQIRMRIGFDWSDASCNICLGVFDRFILDQECWFVNCYNDDSLIIDFLNIWIIESD